MDAVDYGGTSEEDTAEHTTRSSSTRKAKTEGDTVSRSPSNPQPPQDSTARAKQADETINNALDNLASLIPILQSHQKAIEFESNDSNLHNLTRTADIDTKRSKHSKTPPSSKPAPPQAMIPNGDLSANPAKDESVAYFILRSNNEENVRTSMEKKVWATQSQNEPVLNDAFEKFDKVILFFSVCRSMHFQGLCQMTSRIGHHKSRCLWESDHKHVRGKAKWGGTFTVRWLRIFDLPFDQTNNICNPWNGNRPVKFSRDGQPVPAHVGQQLKHLFDIGVMEFGQGSAILRKPIRIGLPHENQIAVQKMFVNGRFVAAMDFESAQNMIVNEEERNMNSKGCGNNNNIRDTNSNHHHHMHTHTHQNSNYNNDNNANDILRRFVSNGNVLDGITVNGLCKLLEGDSNSNRERERDRDRHRDRDRERDRESSRRKRKRDSKHHKRRSRRRDRERDRERGHRSRSRRREKRSDSDYHKRKHSRHDDREKQREQQNVINSLWTQIQMQQALMSQSGLYNADNANTANNVMTSAPPPTYPSNRGGVY